MTAPDGVRRRVAVAFTRPVLAVALVIACHAAANAQTAAAPSDHRTTGVIHPPAKIDPKMAVSPPKNVQLPTPIVRPPAAKDTVVVPK